MTNRPPLKSITPFAAIQYGISIALREGEIDGLLTKESVLRISKRADDLAQALIAGKIVNVHANGTGTIRDVEPDEESELDAEHFPLHAKSKTVLDV